jgi:hypothetical protein
MWLTDPKTNEKSVTLTFLTLSFIALFVVSVLSIMGKVASVGAFEELLYSTAALYFGRRFSIKGKSYSGNEEKDA